MYFFDEFIEYAGKTPEKVLLSIDNQDLTFAQFMEQTAVIAAGLTKLGIGVNDKVGLIMPNSINWYLVYWSAIRIGAQPVPIDPQSGSIELESLLPATAVKVVFVYEKYRTNNILNAVKSLVPEQIALDRVVVFGDEKLVDGANDVYMSFSAFAEQVDKPQATEEIFIPDSKHIMSLACTSGSTGVPKILSVPYEGFYQAEVDMGKYMEFTPDDVIMVGMTLYHQGGFGMGLQNTVCGGTAIYQPQFEPTSFLKTVKERKVTVIQLTSTLAKVLIATPEFSAEDMKTVKVCYFAGEVLPREIADFFVEKLNIRVINVIGSSETATMVVWDSDKDYGTDPSDFRKLPFTDYEVLDACEDENGKVIGELCITTTAVITEYVGNPELSAQIIRQNADGTRSFRTGDLVEKLPDGKVRFAGRSKRIIKRGGNLVHAEEVETCLLTHPDIVASAVVAVEHEVIGQAIVAYVQTVDNKEITRGEIARFFNGKLSSYKVPDQVIVVDEIPKDIGKIQFKYLRKKG